MPIYTVKAFDGKTLQVQADNQSGLDQAMQDYEAGRAALPSPQIHGTQSQVPTGMANGIQGTPQSPDAPLNNRVLDTVSDVISSATPVGPLMDLMTNQGHYSEHPVRTALDMASLGLNVLPGFSEGSTAIKALAGGMLGSGAGTAVADAANVQNPILRAGMQIGGSLVGGGLGGGSKNFEPNPEAAALTANGGQPTLAQSLKPGFMQKLTGAYETVGARTNPVLMNKFANIDASNAGAVRNAAEGNFGNDILQPESAVNTGNQLKGQLQAMADARASEYAPAVAALKNTPGFPNYGKSLLENLGDEISNGDRTVTDSAKNAFMSASKDALNGKNTPISVDKALTDIQIKFANKFPGLQGPAVGQLQGDFSYMMGLLKDAHYDALNRLSGSVDASGNAVAGTLGDEIRAAKGDYATATQSMNPLVRAVQARNAAPERIGQGVLNSGSQGVAGVAAENPDVQQALARSILESAKSGPESSISAGKLGTAINKNRANLTELGQPGDDLRTLQAMAAKAGQQDVGVANPSKTGAFIGAGANLGALTQPHLWPALAANTGLGSAYAYGGIPIYNAARTAVLNAPGAAPATANALSQAIAALGVTNGR